METKEKYLQHKILEQGWIKSATIPNASIHVCCREGCDDYSNIYVSYLTNEKEIYFRLTKQLPSLEQLKELVVFDEVSDEKVKEIYDFITSQNSLGKSTVFCEIGSLLSYMEYEKLPKPVYLKMLNEGTLKDFIDL
jgi:hypothetical protein